MKIAVLGTGVVGETIGTKLASLGHEVTMGSRNATHEGAAAWARKTGGKAATFADATAHCELAFLCTKGEGALGAVAGAQLDGKVLIDITNPLDFSKGFPPSLTVCNTDSLGEQIQRALPKAKVVKGLNTITADLMIAPEKLAGGEHDLFICGNDADAKRMVTDTVLKGFFGWKHVIDLGDLTNARGTEGYLLLWVRMYGALKSPMFNVHVAR